MSNTNNSILLNTEVISSVKEIILTHGKLVVPELSFSITIERELYNRPSITIKTEISIENYETTKDKVVRQLLQITAPIFRQFPMLECLVMRFDISDDKVAVSNEYIEREHIFVWEQNPIDDYLAQHLHTYWD